MHGHSDWCLPASSQHLCVFCDHVCRHKLKDGGKYGYKLLQAVGLMLEGTRVSCKLNVLHTLWLDADHTRARSFNTDLIRVNPAPRPSPPHTPPLFSTFALAFTKLCVQSGMTSVFDRSAHLARQ